MKKSKSTISYKTRDKIWECLGANLRELEAYLRRIRKDLNVYKAGTSLKLSCPNPFHNDSTPSTFLTPAMGLVSCFGCDLKERDPVEFIRSLHPEPRPLYSDVLAEISQEFSTTFLTRQAEKELVEYNLHLKAVKVFNDVMEDIPRVVAQDYTALNDETGIIKHAFEYLCERFDAKTDKDKSHILSLPVGIWPTMDYLQKALAQRYQKDQTALGEAAVDYTESVFKIYNELDGTSRIGQITFGLAKDFSTIVGWRLRKARTKDCRVLIPKYDDNGLFGLHYAPYRELVKTKTKKTDGIVADLPTIIVEGDFDLLQYLYLQVKHDKIPECVAVATGGKNNPENINDLGPLGISDICFMADAPDKQGDVCVRAWLQATTDTRLFTKVFTGWNLFPGAKDPDEALLHYGYDKFHDVVMKYEDHSLYSYDWAFEQVSDNALSQLDSNNVAKVIQAASDGGSILKTPAERDAYIDRVCKAYNVNKGTLQRDIHAKTDDEAAFVARIRELIETDFETIGVEKDTNQRRLVMSYRHDHTRQAGFVVNSPSQNEGEIATFHGPPMDWVERTISIPEFLKPDLKQQMTRKKHREAMAKDLRHYLTESVMQIAQSAPDYGAKTHLGDGFHVVKHDGKPHFYLASGYDAYHTVYEPGRPYEFTQLDSPAHNNVLVNIWRKDVGQIEPWLKHVRSASDLNAGSGVALKSVYERIKEIIDVCFRLKHHETSSMFYASHIMALPIAAVFQRIAMLYITGQTNTGKSTLAGWLCGLVDSRCRLLSCAEGMDSYTAAGVRQAWAHSTRPLILDECEFSNCDEARIRENNRLMADLRGVATGEGVKSVRGSQDQVAVKTSLSMPVIMCGINPPTRAQDFNRLVYLHTEKHAPLSKRSPVDVMLLEFGEQHIQQLMHDLEVAMYFHVPQLLANQQTIRRDYVQGQLTSAFDNRYMEGLITNLSILTEVDVDYKDYLAQYSDERKDSEEARARTQTESVRVFNTVLNARPPHQRPQEGEVPLGTVEQCLSNNQVRSQLNDHFPGMYFYGADMSPNKKDYLIVHWDQVKTDTLKNSEMLRGQTNMRNFAMTVNRTERAVQTEEERETIGVYSFLKTKGIWQAPAVTVYDITDIIEEIGKYRNQLADKQDVVKLPLHGGKANDLPTLPDEDDEDINPNEVDC